MSKVTIYAKRQNGERARGVRIGGVDVLLTPKDEKHEADADRMAATLLGAETDREDLVARLRETEATVEDLRRTVRSARAAASEAEARAVAATEGRRRFFGPVVLEPAQPGAWDGPVWLLDPEKRASGTGLRFASLAEVHLLHPELWIVGVTPDGILLDAWAARAPDAPGPRFVGLVGIASEGPATFDPTLEPCSARAPGDDAP